MFVTDLLLLDEKRIPAVFNEVGDVGAPERIADPPRIRSSGPRVQRQQNGLCRTFRDRACARCVRLVAPGSASSGLLAHQHPYDPFKHTAEHLFRAAPLGLFPK